ncbi:hypothetical protein, partial [Mycolicibacterium hippocampi]|uniref:hypothetical protein n=1 Tax=Mycolicibacterium hippocampi TaxID=659824 RepID=UPI0021F2DB3D
MDSERTPRPGPYVLNQTDELDCDTRNSTVRMTFGRLTELAQCDVFVTMIPASEQPRELVAMRYTQFCE